jgi:hypothetical protein
LKSRVKSEFTANLPYGVTLRIIWRTLRVWTSWSGARGRHASACLLSVPPAKGDKESNNLQTGGWQRGRGRTNYYNIKDVML